MSDGSVESAKKNLIDSLRRQGLLKTREVEEALREIRREDFLWPDEPKALAYLDEPLALGKGGQTISAPHMILIMLEALQLSSGMKVLEVGTGSGYNAALLASIVSREIKGTNETLVVSLERDKLLAEFATRNIARAGLAEFVKVVCCDGSLGYPEGSDSPIYDRIIITAATPSIPSLLLKQLKAGGIILAPVGGRQYQNLTRVRKSVAKEGQEESLQSEELCECIFVPLIGEQAYHSC